MKKVVSLLITLALLCASFTLAEGLTPGTYTGSANSVGGPLEVSVTVGEDGIKAIDITEIHDSEGVYNAAAERIPQQVIEHQSVNVDTVSGATLTSIFLKNAIKDALSQVGDIDAYSEAAHWSAPGCRASNFQFEPSASPALPGITLPGAKLPLQEGMEADVVVLMIYGTYGGVAVDLEGHALNNDGNIVPGLYACGEVTGSRDFQETGAYAGGLGPALTTGHIAAMTALGDM